QYQDQWRRWLGIPGTATWRVPLPLVRAQVWFGERLGRGPVNRTIWNMLLRGNRTGENAWQTVRDTFGVRLRALGEVLADTSSQMQDRWAAQLYFLAPCLKWAMVALWLASAWVGWLTPASDIERFAQNSLLAEFAPVLTARLSAGLDLLLGLGLALARRPRPVVLAMLAMTLAYLVCIGVAMPAAFMEPLGGLIKNLALLPALAVLWVVVDRR
ncbi:MAG: complex I NDUFA9 subunit family protein, partial [Xanthomonadales bacterium]|nr:complex I NDUFA9 subunit family protein [Xanthomonadales bacterium]